MSTQSTQNNKHFWTLAPATRSPRRRGLPGMILASLAVIGVCLSLPVARAQTVMTIKPQQIRIGVPSSVAGTYYINPCNLRIPTNGATGTDGTGTNWIIPSVNVSISGAPSGCTATLVDSGLVNPI